MTDSSPALGYDACGFPGSHEVARVHGGELEATEPVREGDRLTVPVRGQRSVGMALPAAVSVPVALAVAGQQDGGHGRVS